MTKLLLTLILLTGAFYITPQAFTQKVVTAAQVNGTWREAASRPAGVTTEMKILALGNNELKIEFNANNAAKKFSNNATGTATIEGTTAIFKPTDAQVDENNPCTIKLNFAGGKLKVTETGDCGWGAGVGSNGNYRRISTKKPAFEN